MRTHYHTETNRWWLYGKNHCALLNLEWSFLKPTGLRFGVDFRKGWSIQQISIGLPFLFQLWINFGSTDEWAEYELGFYYFERALWFHLFSNPVQSHSNDPWYRRLHCFDFVDFFLGRSKYKSEQIGESQEVEIPMPEKTYKGIAKHERHTWKRPLWFKRVRDSIWIDVDGGIPFPGKGENSWDCGMDAICGAGHDGTNVERAIGHFVGSVLSNRRKYGGKNWKYAPEAIQANQSNIEPPQGPAKNLCKT